MAIFQFQQTQRETTNDFNSFADTELLEILHHPCIYLVAVSAIIL